MIKAIDTTTGMVPFATRPTAPLPADQVLTPPGDCMTGGYCNFGYSLLATDIMDCVVINSVTWPPTTVGCGEELLVSAPSVGHGTSTGRVLIYRPQTGPGVNGFLQFVGEVPVPAGADLGDEFGFAMAAGRRTDSWQRAPDHPPWLAIAAPASSSIPGTATEDGPVYLFEVNPTAPMPLGSAQDPFLDLAVGAPSGPAGTPSSGNVWIHFGDTPTSPTCAGPCVVSPVPLLKGGTTVGGFNLDGADTQFASLLGPAAGLQPDEFGSSLSLGLVVDSDRNASDALIVGAPGHDLAAGPPSADYGAVCWFEWDNTGSTVTNECSDAPGPTPGERFGYSVQAGNFSITDSRGVVDLENGPIHEVAVASLDATSGTGRVEVFASSPNGVLAGDVLAVLDHPDGGVLAGERFGRALGSGYGQDSPWQDLVIGSPFRDGYGAGRDGSVTLTKTVPVNACTPIEVSGEWETVDHAGEASFAIPADTVLDLANVWPCGSGSHTFPDVPAEPLIAALAPLTGNDGKTVAGEVLDVTLTLASPTDLLVDIDIAKLDFAKPR